MARRKNKKKIKQHSPELRAEVVAHSYEHSVRIAAKKFGVSTASIYKWQKRAKAEESPSMNNETLAELKKVEVANNIKTLLLMEWGEIPRFTEIENLRALAADLLAIAAPPSNKEVGNLRAVIVDLLEKG